MPLWWLHPTTITLLWPYLSWKLESMPMLKTTYPETFTKPEWCCCCCRNGDCDPDGEPRVFRRRYPFGSGMDRCGVIGKVHRVDCWTNRPVWPQGFKHITEEETIPDTLNWDIWLGPAAMRPYNHNYLPFKWRGFWDFGTGAMGDMGCHIMETPLKPWGWDFRMKPKRAVPPFGPTILWKPIMQKPVRPFRGALDVRYAKAR